MISPAKRLAERSVPAASEMRWEPPMFEERSRALAQIMKKFSAAQLSELMDVSSDIAQLNRDRFRNFPASFSNGSTLPAIAQFQGDVYQAMNVESYTKAQMEFLQNHVLILSGLYGLLRPLDKMHPYRLEMGTSLKGPGFNSLYHYWGKTITSTIQDRIHRTGEKALLNLASKEYSRAVKFKDLDIPVIGVDFLELRSGKWKTVSYNAKRARGLMLDWIVRNRINDIEKARSFRDGYAFDEEKNEPGQTRWIFKKID
ncbi:MAG: YaaA family protein [Leptospiraceae bacterium]|nr:YaaA family protein [Leptospiraceae bacterium]